ncbi:metallophosphoesterase [Paraclostridium sp. AKS46]|nr:metallophosphoesterase [Paraclostridium sp. AKS46]
MLLIFSYARYIEPSMLRVKNIDLKAKDIKDCRIVFFTDTHFGKLYSQSNIDKIVKKINNQNPDIVIFGGDLLDNYARDYSLLDTDSLQKSLSKIEAKYGKYAVFGNHDYGGGASRVYEKFMSGGGFKVLKNESSYINDLNLNIIGYDDYLLGNTKKSDYKIEENKFNLVVTHEPDVVELMTSSSENFILSGHSHGGQVTIPFITDKILPVGAHKYVKGLYSEKNVGINDSTKMYVSSGIGMTSIPLRFLNPPEIVVFNISAN